MIEWHVGEVPASLGTPEAMAWLDQVAARPRTPESRVNRALRALSAAEANRLAGRLIDQQVAWKAAGLIPREGSVTRIDDIVFYFLGDIRGNYGPLDPALEPRARGLALPIHDLYGTYDPDVDGPMGEEDECPYFEAGVALVPASDAGNRASAARAGNAEWLPVAKFA